MVGIKGYREGQRVWIKGQMTSILNLKQSEPVCTHVHALHIYMYMYMYTFTCGIGQS